MSVLSDAEILESVKSGKLGIEPFDETRLTPNGYDLSIREILLLPNDRFDRGTVRVSAGKWFAVSTKEYVRLPADIVGHLWIRTSWARKGVVGSFGVVDAGFEGELTLSAAATTRDVEVGVGSTFAQIVFHRLGRASEKAYAKRSGNYQGQRDVTLDPKSK